MKAWQWHAEVHTHTEENVDVVEELTLSQEHRPQTHHVARQISNETDLS